MKQELTLENLLYGLRCPDTRIRRATWEYFCRNYADNPVCQIENIDFNQTDCWGKPFYLLTELYSEFFLVTNNYHDDKHCTHFFKMLEQDNSSLATEYLINLTTRGIYQEYKNQLLTILQNRKYDCVESLIFMLEHLRSTNEEIFLPLVINNISNFELSLVQLHRVCKILNNTLLRQEKYQPYGLGLLKNLKIAQDETIQEKLVVLWKSIALGYLNSDNENPEYLALFSRIIGEYCNSKDNIALLFTHHESLLNNPYIFCGSKVEIIQNFINLRSSGNDEKVRISQSEYLAETLLIKNVCQWINSQLSEAHDDIKAIYILPLCEQLEDTTSGHLKIDVFNVVSKALLLQFYQPQYHSSNNIANITWKDTHVIDNKVKEHTYHCLDFIKKLLQNFSAIICGEMDRNEFLQMCRCLYRHSDSKISNLSKELLLIYLSDFNILRNTLNAFNNNEHGWQEEYLLCDCLDGLKIEHQCFPYSPMLQFLYHMSYDCSDTVLKNKIFVASSKLFQSHGHKFQDGEKNIWQTLKNLYYKNEDNADISNYLYLQKVLIY